MWERLLLDLPQFDDYVEQEVSICNNAIFDQDLVIFLISNLISFLIGFSISTIILVMI
jgi:hypothetical protein